MADNGVDTGDSQPPADKTQINESHDAAENNPPKDAPFPKGTEGFVVDHSGATDDFCNEAGEKNDNDTSVNVNNGDPDSIGGEDPKKGGKRKEAKSITRTRYSNDFKVKVLDELAVSNYTVAEMARRHKLPEATVRDWLKTKDKITTAQVNRRGSAKSNSRDNLQKVTDALRTFMDLNDRLGACGMSKLPITNAMIAKQGQEVKGILLEKDRKHPFLTAQERKTLNAFNASIWWSKKWARKHNLHSVGHREAAKAAAAMSSRVPEIRKEYSRDHVFFVVDTMLFYKVLPTRSYVVREKGDSATAPPPIGQGRKYLETLEGRVSLFISANSSGNHKIPLTMINDAQDPPSFVASRQKVFPCMYQENAWANPKMLLSWWKDVFLPNIRSWTDEKVLLVLKNPSFVDLDDPQQQVKVEFLPPLLSSNHNNTVDGLSVSSFFEPPVNMLSVVKTKYRYELLREVLQIYEEREQRREVARKAGLATPGLKQGHLPHLQDCMRILNSVWTKLPPSAISSEEEEGFKKKKKRKRRKKKGTTENDIIENEAMSFSDDLGTDDVIKQIIHFFRRHSDIVEPEGTDVNPFDKAVAEVKSCFLNEKLLLKTNQDQLRSMLQNWIALEDAQDIRTMLQTEIMGSMNFKKIIDVDEAQESGGAVSNIAGTGGKAVVKEDAAEKSVEDDIALDCATQLLVCAARLSKENPVFHDLASKLIEASDLAFVALRESKLPPEERAMNKKDPPPPKKRKTRTVTVPPKKRVKVAALDKFEIGGDEEGVTAPNQIGAKASILEGETKGESASETACIHGNAADHNEDYEGAVFQI